MSDKDVALITGRTADNKGATVIRLKDDEVSVGELRALEDGKPITGEVVKLTPRDGSNLCDVDVVLEGPKKRESKGPANVATESYRSNWDLVFGSN